MSKALETAAPKAADAIEAAAAETPIEKAATTSVTFLRSHPAYGYFAGDATELPVDVADALIESKHAEKTK